MGAGSLPIHNSVLAASLAAWLQVLPKLATLQGEESWQEEEQEEELHAWPGFRGAP